MTLSVRPIDPVSRPFFGGVASGIDITQPLSREQAAEIEMTRSFLEDLDMTRRGWVMCYPHGAYNRVTIDLLHEKGCTIALTTRRGVANIEAENLYELPRLDTNEIPLA